MNLKEIVMGAAILSVIVGLQLNISSDHISNFNTDKNFDNSELDKLQQLDNISSTADVARQNAQGVEARSNYFNLPGIIEILKMPLDTLNVYNTTLPIIGDVLHIPYQVVYLGILFLTLTAIFMFARRNR